MKYPPPTPEDIENLRKLLHEHGWQLQNFADDMVHLYKMRDCSDALLLAALQTIIDKGERFMNWDGAQFLNKKVGDEPKDKPRARRTYGHVVQSKKEKARRESGGGHTNVTSQSSGQFGWDHGFRPPHNKSERPDADLLPPWDDDDDIPF